MRQVAVVLDFRNRHAASPFLCERFHPKSFFVPKGESTTLWPSIYPAPSGDAGGGTLQESIEHKACIRTCPYGRRVQLTSVSIYNPDAMIDAGHRDIPSALYSAHGVIQTYTYPLQRSPTVLLSLLQRQNVSVRVSLPTCLSSSAPNSASALAFFAEMAPEASLLRDLAAYPNASDSLVVTVECVDGVTYCLGGPSNPRIGALEVDAWIASVTSDTVTTSTYSSVVGHSESVRTDCQDHCIDRQFEPSVLLSLRGDLFTVYEPGCSAGRAIHVNLLHFDDSFIRTNGHDEDDAVSSGGVEVSTGGMFKGERNSDVLWRLRRHARRLVCYRDYLDRNMAFIPSLLLPPPPQSIAVDKQGRPLRPPGSDAREPIILHTSNGTKFAALLDLQGLGTIVMLHGAFPDHSQLNLCLVTRTVACVLPSGDTVTYTLEQCLDASNSNDVFDPLTAAYTSQHRLSAMTSGPSASIASHLRALLAFKRWALTPPNQRLELEHRDLQLSLLAQTAALRNQRHVLIMGMQRNEVHLSLAKEQTNELKRRLRLLGRDAACFMSSRNTNSTSTGNGNGGDSITKRSMSEQGLRIRLDPRLAESVHNTTVRHKAKQELAACDQFLKEVSTIKMRS